MQEDGKRALGYRLRGYIFFGSVGPLTERLKESLAGPRRLQCLLLDFSAVTGFDFSAVSSLSRFLRLASEKGISVVLSGASPRLMSAMERNLPASAFSELISEANLDCALERCEDIIVSAWNEKAAVRDDRRTALLAKVADGLERHLDQQVRLELLIEELGNWLVPCDYSAGDAMATNSPSEGIEILADGLATARDVDGKRLRQFGAGDVILGNAGLGMPRASVIAEGPCRTVVLSPTAQRVLEAQDSKLALKLYRYLVSTHFGLSCDHASQAT